MDWGLDATPSAYLMAHGTDPKRVLHGVRSLSSSFYILNQIGGPALKSCCERSGYRDHFESTNCAESTTSVGRGTLANRALATQSQAALTLAVSGTTRIESQSVCGATSDQGIDDIKC